MPDLDVAVGAAPLRPDPLGRALIPPCIHSPIHRGIQQLLIGRLCVRCCQVQGWDVAVNETVGVSTLTDPRVGETGVYDVTSVVMVLKGADRLSCPCPTLPGRLLGG